MKWKVWAAVAAGAVVVGILLGFMVQLEPSGTSGESTISFDEVILGMPAVLPTEDNPWQPADRLTQKRNYATNEPLALRVVSREPAEQQISLTARLLKEDGSLQALSPATFTVSGGTGGFCCWTVAPAGKYKLQIFAAGQAPFVFPLTIVPERKNASPLRLQ